MDQFLNHKSPDTVRSFITYLLIVAIGFGIGARIVRYGANLTLWGDESYVAVNIIERTPSRLMQPLDNRQVAPPVWLWAARACWKVFGSLNTLRLPALAGGLAAIGVFALLARRVLRTEETVWAIALFAASYPMIRYSVETKPYATDALAATIILACVAFAFVPGKSASGKLTSKGLTSGGSVGGGISRGSTSGGSGGSTSARPLFLLALLLPVLLWLSYPAVIVTVGVGVWAIVMLIRQRSNPSLRLHRWGVACCIVTAGIAMLLLGLWVIIPARHRADGFMQGFWALGFPPYKPWLLPWWLLKAHTGKMMSYPLGDKNFGSTFTTVLFLAGIIALWQSHRRAVLWLLLSIMLAALALAFAKVYPYGVHVRIMLFLSPVICLIAAVGIERIARWLREDHAMIWRAVIGGVLLVIPIVVSAGVIHQRFQQNRLADVAGVLRWVNDQATAHDVPIYCFNTLNSHKGSGPKIEFELYMMTQLHRPVFDAGRLPSDDMPRGAIFFTIVYDHVNDTLVRAQAIAAWKAKLDARAKVVAHRSARMELNSGGTLHVAEYEVSPPSPLPVPDP